MFPNFPLCISFFLWHRDLFPGCLIRTFWRRPSSLIFWLLPWPFLLPIRGQSYYCSDDIPYNELRILWLNVHDSIGHAHLQYSVLCCYTWTRNWLLSQNKVMSLLFSWIIVLSAVMCRLIAKRSLLHCFILNYVWKNKEFLYLNSNMM